MRRCRVPMIVRWDRGAPAGLAARGKCWASEKCPGGFLCRGGAKMENGNNDDIEEIKTLRLSINVADRVFLFLMELLCSPSPFSDITYPSIHAN